MTETTNRQFMSIAPLHLHRRMQADDTVTLVDVRSTAEYRAGHARGALSLPLDEIDEVDLAQHTGNQALGKEQVLYLTCQQGVRAEKAAQLLYANGLHNLALLKGGTDAWEKEALPMRRCGNAISLERQVQITIGTLLILKVAFGFTVHELFFVLAALIGAGLITAGITRWCGMAQLLARMPWNRGRDCTDSNIKTGKVMARRNLSNATGESR